MKFNLAPHRRIFSDSGPYKALTEEQLAKLSDGDTVAVGFSVSGETAAVVCDLGSRYRLSEIRYYRSAATLENIAIFGKQGPGSGFPWVELAKQIAGTLVFSNVELLSDKYQLVKVVHTVITGSSNVYELEVISDDSDSALFGIEGETTAFSIDSGTETLLPERIDIFNDSGVDTTYYCLLEAEDSDSLGLQLASVSGTVVSGTLVSGTFYGLHEHGLSVPNTYEWFGGFFVNTTVVNNSVVLSIPVGSGYYYTPVIDISGLESSRVFFEVSVSGTTASGVPPGITEIDDTTAIDSVATVAVRLSNTTPTDGGWVSGQNSNDANWHRTTGLIPFELYSNNQIFRADQQDYFQARVELVTTVSGPTPVLKRVGVEEGFRLDIPANTASGIYVKSSFDDHSQGRDSSLLVWFFEDNNDEQ